jgi:hypothetical protein
MRYLTVEGKLMPELDDQQAKAEIAWLASEVTLQEPGENPVAAIGRLRRIERAIALYLRMENPKVAATARDEREVPLSTMAAAWGISEQMVTKLIRAGREAGAGKGRPTRSDAE